MLYLPVKCDRLERPIASLHASRSHRLASGMLLRCVWTRSRMSNRCLCMDEVGLENEVGGNEEGERFLDRVH